MPNLTVPLVGMHFNPPAKQVLAILPAGTPFRLEAEPDNPYDPEAIVVLLDLEPVVDALDKLPEVCQLLEESLVGTGFDLAEIRQGGTMKMGHVGASGRGPCQKLGLPGTQEVHELAEGLEGGLEDLGATLAFTPDGVPTLLLAPKGGEG